MADPENFDGGMILKRKAPEVVRGVGSGRGRPRDPSGKFWNFISKMVHFE